MNKDMITVMIQKLQRAADALIDLRAYGGNENAATARAIGAAVKPYGAKRKQGKRRKGLHWTQRPENKAKLAAVLAKASRARYGK